MSILLNCSDILMQAMILLFSFLITFVSHENLAGSVVTVNVVAQKQARSTLLFIAFLKYSKTLLPIGPSFKTV